MIELTRRVPDRRARPAPRRRPRRGHPAGALATARRCWRAYVRFGASPRGAQALVLAGKVAGPARRPAERRRRRRPGRRAGRPAPPARRRLRGRRRRRHRRRPDRRTCSRPCRPRAPACAAPAERVAWRCRRAAAGRVLLARARAAAAAHAPPAGRPVQPASTAPRTSARRVDFADYREYHPGDDYRRIDYPLFARTGHLFIRLFEAEDDVSAAHRPRPLGVDGLPRQARPGRPAGGGDRLRRPAPPRHGHAAHRAGRRSHRAGSPAATPRGACSRRSPRSTRRGRPTSPVPPATSSPGPARPASPSSSPTCSTRGGTGPIDRLVARGGDTTVLHVLADDELHPDLPRRPRDGRRRDRPAGRRSACRRRARATTRAPCEAWLGETARPLPQPRGDLRAGDGRRRRSLTSCCVRGDARGRAMTTGQLR